MSFPSTLISHQFTAPAAADGVAITTAAVPPWTNTAWVTVLASAGAHAILTGITIRPTFAVYSGPYGSVEVDIGIGSTPTVIATFTCFIDANYYARGTDQGLYFPCPIGIAGIVSGQPIKARLRHQSAFAGTWRISVMYCQVPLTGELETTANAQYVLPSAAEHVHLGMVAWGNSQWETLAVGGDRYVVAMSVVGYAGDACEVDLGTGDAVVSTIPLFSQFPTGFPFYAALITPIRVTGDLQVRARKRTTGELLVALAVVDAPL